MRRTTGKTRLLGLVASILILGAASESAAQTDEWGGDVSMGGSPEVGLVSYADYPVERARRPITLPSHMLRIDGGFTVGHLEMGADDTYAMMEFGAAFGILDELEVGISPHRTGSTFNTGYPFYRHNGAFSLSMAPDVEFGDIPLYGRYRFLDTDVAEIGVDLVLVIPANTDFSLGFGVPIRLYFGQSLSLDTGIEVFTTFFERCAGGGPGVGFCEDFTVGTFVVPAHFNVNLTAELFLSIQAGFGLYFGDFFDDTLFMPLGFQLGYTIPDGDTPMLDILAGFRWPALFVDDSDDAVWQDYWELRFGAQFYLPL